MGGGDAPPPKPVLPPLTDVLPENVGRTGYGEIRGERTSMYSGDVKHSDTFPEDITPLELKNWYNYSLRKDYPSMIPSHEENRNIWQNMEVERMMDVHPTHEIHPRDLPSYHYWPPIQNEYKPKIKDTTSEFVSRYQQDQTDIPRFSRPGTPVTPPQEQDWYIPLKEDGRFDYKKNNEINGYSGSIFDRKGWNKRFMLTLNTQSIYALEGWRGLTQPSINFRHQELSLGTKFTRFFYGSTFDKYMVFSIFYIGALVWASHKGADYHSLNWDNEAWNYDIEFNRYNRDKGGYHGLI